jgi:hypothetical protein
VAVRTSGWVLLDRPIDKESCGVFVFCCPSSANLEFFSEGKTGVKLPNEI